MEVDNYANTQTAQCGVMWHSPPLPNGPHAVSEFHIAMQRLTFGHDQVVITTGQSQAAAADGHTASTFELDGFT